MSLSGRERARRIYADAIAARGPAWANSAGSIRTGYENIWIGTAIGVIEQMLRLVPDEDEDDQGGGA